MSKLTVKTNHQFRDVVYGYELTDKERKEFDYLTEEELEFRSFARYKGWTYDLNEFTRAPDSFPGWDGIQSDSYFSGVVIKYDETCEQVKLGTYTC